MALVRNDKDIGNSGKLTGMDGSERKGGWVALDVVIVPRCVWARESTAPVQGNQSLSRELRASALCPVPGSPVPSTPERREGLRACYWEGPSELPERRSSALRPGAVAQSPGREAALAWASLAQRFPASSVLARAGAGCGSVGDVTGAWLASAPLSPSLWT